MYTLKTRETDVSVAAFISALDSPKKRVEAEMLLEIFNEATQMEAKMWGPSIIGYGRYHYRYASGHEGDAMLVGFSPRKAKMSLYLSMEPEMRAVYLERLGKHSAGKGCIYVNRLSDINRAVLIEMIQESIVFLTKKYG
jgi:hypothetical protein